MVRPRRRVKFVGLEHINFDSRPLGKYVKHGVLHAFGQERTSTRRTMMKRRAAEKKGEEEEEERGGREVEEEEKEAQCRGTNKKRKITVGCPRRKIAARSAARHSHKRPASGPPPRTLSRIPICARHRIPTDEHFCVF